MLTSHVIMTDRNEAKKIKAKLWNYPLIFHLVFNRTVESEEGPEECEKTWFVFHLSRAATIS